MAFREPSSERCHCVNNKLENDYSKSSVSILNKLSDETERLIVKSEHLVRLMTHVCCHKFTGGISRTYNNYPIYNCASCEDACIGWQCYQEAKFTDRAFNNCTQRGSAAFTSSRGHRRPDSVCTCGRNLTRERRCYKSSKWRLFFPLTGAQPPAADESPPSQWSWKETSSYCKDSGSSYSIWGRGKTPFSKSYLLTLVLLIVTVFARVTESCSSRSTPKPRPASPTLRPNITYQTYTCPFEYAAWYCLNGATCFTLKVQETILYNCECPEGYRGSRCEFKDLAGSYSAKNVETASIAGVACVAILLVFIVLFIVYVFMHKDREKKRALEYDDFKDQRTQHCENNCRPEYVYTVSSMLHNIYFNVKDSERLSSVRVHSPSSKKSEGEKPPSEFSSEGIPTRAFGGLRDFSL